jgi:putative DNA primase/helicase
VETHDCSAEKIIKCICSGKWHEPIEHIRRVFSSVLVASPSNRQAAKEAVAADKKKLPGVMWSGQFSSRERSAAQKLLKHSGLLCADLDDLGERLADVRAKLQASLHLFALFASPTGNGLKAIFRVVADAAEHAASFRAVQRHVYELTGEKIDESCKDIARLCFVSFDPDVFMNANATELPLWPEEKQVSRKEKGSLAMPQIETRRRIAIGLVGEIQWDTDTHGFCRCPGQHLHTTGNSERACEIHLDCAATVHCFHNHCEGIVAGVNHELRSRIGKTERAEQKQSASVVNKAPAWGEPQSLPKDLPDVPTFDFDCLPNTLRPWIQDIAERMQCPPDFPAVGAMIALGSLVGRKIGIRPKRHDDWLVIPNFWGGVVGRPGLMKTPALEQALLPLRRLVAEALEKYEAEMQGHKAGAMIHSQRTKLAELAIKTHLKKGDEEGARAEAESLAEGEEAQPILRRYEVNDSTVAKLGELLAQNSNGLLVHRDELVGFLRGLDKEGYEDARAFFLESWNGTGSFTFDRIGRGTVRVESNTLSLIGGIQPDVLTGYVREAVRGGIGADGLLQRFQFAVWPDVSKEWRNIDRWPDLDAKNEAFGVFKYLDELTPEAVGADGNGILFLRFSIDAQERFDSWRAELEQRLRADTEHPAFEAHLAKYRKLVPALALLIHLANRDVGPVSLNALEKAFVWATYLEAHARRIYSAVLRPDTAAARELAKHLQRGELPERFTLRETYRKGWAGLNSKEDAEAATEILCDLEWIRPVSEIARTKPGRAPSAAFETNPKISAYHWERTDKTDTINSGSSVSEAKREIGFSSDGASRGESAMNIGLVEELI